MNLKNTMKDIKKILTTLNIGALFIAYDTYFKELAKQQGKSRIERLENTNEISKINNINNISEELKTKSNKLDRLRTQDQTPEFSKEFEAQLEQILRSATVLEGKNQINKSKEYFVLRAAISNSNSDEFRGQITENPTHPNLGEGE